jgi:type I restriction enzyme S subunit
MKWIQNKLADISEIVMGQSPESSFYNMVNIGMPFLQGCGEFGKVSPDTNIFSSQVKKIGRQNSILFSVRAPVGRINLADRDYCIGRGLCAISGRKIDQGYLYQYFQFLKLLGGFSSQGSTFDSINFNELSKTEIFYPETKTEQQRIATILGNIDLSIEQTENLISKYKCIKAGFMQDMLLKGIDSEGNIRNKATHKFIVQNDIEIPEGWEIKTLDLLIKAIDAQPNHRTPPLVENGVPYLGISDIDENGNVDLRKCRKVSVSILEEHNKRYTLRAGDILFGKIGTIGEPKRLKVLTNITISANVILIQPHETPDFIFWTLNSEYVNTQVKNAIHSTSQPAFGMEKIRALIILVPPKKEREIIQRILNENECHILSTKKNLTKLHSLKKGLMQDLLTGKVRIK